MEAVRRELVLPVEAEEAWEAVTGDGWLDVIEAWAGGDVADGDRAGEVDDVDPGRRISWTWRDGRGRESVVDLTLVPDAEGTRVVVVELQRPPAVAAAGPPRAPEALCLAA